MKKIVLALLIVLLCLSATACGGSNSYTADDINAATDWGPDHYYNSGTGKVEKNLHGILGN